MKVAIIDLDSLCFSAGNGIKLLDEQGNPLRENNKFVYRDKLEEELSSSVDFYMNGLLRSGGFTHYIGYIKGSNTTDRRLAANPDYKGNRSGIEPAWWKFVKNDLITRWKAVEVNGLEVDDAVRITSLELKDSFICAIDGDLLGLEGTHYNWKTGEWFTITKDQAEYNFWCDMIAGQVGDNIKGIPSKGVKFFDKLYLKRDDIEFAVLQAYIDHFGKLEGITWFYKNFISLYILESLEGFIVPEPRPANNIEHLFKK